MLRQRLAFLGLLLAATLDQLDGPVVNIVLPVLQRELRADDSAAQWIGSGYTLTFGLFLITAGRLGDAYGRRRLLLWGIAGFTISSGLCGLAPSAEVMIAARLAQGLSSAVLTPQIIALLPTLFGERERGRALGVYAAVTGVAAVTGQVAGALLTEANPFGLGWRTIFLLNLPGGVLAGALALFALPDARALGPVRVAPLDVGLLTAGLVLLVGPLTLVHRTGWSLQIGLSMLGSVLVLLWFARRQRGRNAALAPAHLFRSRSFVAGLLITIAVFAVVHAFFFTQALTLQHGLAASVLDTALVTLPWVLGVSAGAAGAPMVLTPRFGARTLDLGLGVLTVGFGVVWGGLVTEWSGAWPAGLFVAGLGMGCVTATVLTIALRDLPADDTGVGAGLISSAQQLGGVLGSAALGALFFATWQQADAQHAFQLVVACGVGVLLLAVAWRVREM